MVRAEGRFAWFRFGAEFQIRPRAADGGFRVTHGSLLASLNGQNPFDKRALSAMSCRKRKLTNCLRAVDNIIDKGEIKALMKQQPRSAKKKLDYPDTTVGSRLAASKARKLASKAFHSGTAAGSISTGLWR